MEVIIQPTADKAALLVARLIARRLRAKPAFVLGLATGRTMEQVYGHLAEMHQRDHLDFSLCRTFNLDEYVGLSPKDQHSYRYYMDQHLFSRVNIDRRNTHLPNGAARDLGAECVRYEELIHDCGGIDVQLLGIGADGHIGFNEPTSSLDVSVQQQVLALLSELQVRHGISYIFISHDLAVVRAMSHRVMVMKDGEVIEQGQAQALFDAPQHPYTQALLAAAQLT